MPHTWNDIDRYDDFIHGGGDLSGYQSRAWYRKHFKLNASLQGSKVFVEFEGIRQGAEIYINGTWVGRHENGVGPCGIDISDEVNFGGTDNVLAVSVDNRLGYVETATGVGFVWNTGPFNPIYGGLVGNARLHVTSKVYQTLPLYRNLQTSGPYVYASNIDVNAKSATITAETEVRNEQAAAQTISYTVDLVDGDGNVVLTLDGGTHSIASGQTVKLSASGNLSNARFWSPDYPYLYKTYTILSQGGQAVDVCQTPLGIRQLSFTLAEGLKINGEFIYLKGYAPRSTMEWVTVGKGPTWLGQYDFQLMKENNANFLRPMHVAPRKMVVEAADEFGIIVACPAGDAEGDSQGVQWDQRVELMRDVTIYYRNNPSVLFWEGGNSDISVDHMLEMKSVRDTWDPQGGRLSGTRSTSSALEGIAEYMSTMDRPGGSSTTPVWDAEYARQECPRRVWDKYTPPSFGYVNIADPQNTVTEWPDNSFKLNSTEDLARSNVFQYYNAWSRRGGQGRSEIMVGGAKIIFADSTSHGRMIDTEVARVTGVLEAARLPKQSYHALTVCHSKTPAIHILGHWNYPAGTVKDIIVIANTDDVRLQLFNTSGALVQEYTTYERSNHFEFAFKDIAWQPGSIKAIGYDGGVAVVEHEIITAGDPAGLQLTPITGPQGFIADGSDIAMFDVEVVDADGHRCPTRQVDVHFTYSGNSAHFLGGYNSGVEYSIYKDDLFTENGINRVFVRATRNPGNFTLTATSSALGSASATIEAQSWNVTDGLSEQWPQAYGVELQPRPIDNFFFNDIVGAEFDQEYTSDPITLSGMSEAQTISLAQSNTTAAYSINGGAFTANDGTVNNGDIIRMKITSGSDYAQTTYARINIAGVWDDFSVTTEDIASPDENIALQKPVVTDAAQDGNPGTNAVDGDEGTRWATNPWPATITIDLKDAYSINRAEITPYAGRAYQFIIEGSVDGANYTLISDQTANTVGGSVIAVDFGPVTARYVRFTFSGADGYDGGWVSVYEIRLFKTQADTPPVQGDTRPDQFNIVDQKGLEVFTEVISEPFTVTGIDSPAPISIFDANESASYSVNGGPFTSLDGLVNAGDTVRVQLSTGSAYGNSHFARISIGGVMEDFIVSTRSENNTPPIAAAEANPTQGAAPLPVSFDASGTTDAEGDDLTYTWDFGDGATADGVTVQHTYTAIGTYNAVLTVADKDFISTDHIEISVTQQQTDNNSNDSGSSDSSGGGGGSGGGGCFISSALPAPMADSVFPTRELLR